MSFSTAIPQAFFDMFELADPSWRSTLLRGLEAVAAADPSYLPALAQDIYLPTEQRMFAAFAQPLDRVRYVLIGEGPYPREESATGVCFMDGAVQGLWSEAGLSKQVNRATSLRNFVKMLLVADGELAPDNTGADAMSLVSLKARAIGSRYIQSLSQMQENLFRRGFLLLNAALVFRPHVAPAKDVKAWQPFANVILAELAAHAKAVHRAPPTLILWGKLAEQLDAAPANADFPRAISEHPYNLSFIRHAGMQALFGPLSLLHRERDSGVDAPRP